MSGKINLLPNAAKYKAYKQQWRSLNNKILVAEIAVGIMVGLVALGVSGGLKIWSDKLEREAGRWKTRFGEMRLGVEASQKVKYQAKIVGKVMDGRFEYGEAFAAINQLFPPEVLLEKSDFGEEKTFNVEGTISTDEAVKVVEQMLVDINLGKNIHFYKMELKKMKWSPEGWEFGAIVYLKS